MGEGSGNKRVGFKKCEQCGAPRVQCGLNQEGGAKKRKQARRSASTCRQGILAQKDGEPAGGG